MVVIQQSDTNCDVISRVVETECDWLGNPGRVLVWSHDPVGTIEQMSLTVLHLLYGTSSGHLNPVSCIIKMNQHTCNIWLIALRNQMCCRFNYYLINHKIR